MSAVTVRVRFAPSPTGPLHAGSARTALLNWMFARAHDGELLLRIDDTDEQRSERRWETEIVDGLRALGLDWDAGPFRQSARGAVYAAALERLLAAGAVSEHDGAVLFDGRAIARADGTALYHLATAVDELEDGITHVLRGRDHLSNTELQSKLIVALGERPPEYVHAPLLLGADGAKLSKREAPGGDVLAATTVSGVLAAGVLPDALCNALALSLAEFGEPEVMTTAELPGRFDVAALHSADSQFDHDKLLWLSGQHIRRLDGDAFASALMPFLEGSELPPLALVAAQTAAPTLAGCARAARELVDPPTPDAAAAELLAADRAAEIFGIATAVLTVEPVVGIEQARERVDALKSAFKEAGVPVGKGLRTVRAALSGRVEGVELAYLVGLASSDALRGLSSRIA